MARLGFWYFFFFFDAHLGVIAQMRTRIYPLEEIHFGAVKRAGGRKPLTFVVAGGQGRGDGRREGRGGGREGGVPTRQ